MNLIYLIRLLLKNTFLIVGVALLMAILVFILTNNKPETYTSEMVVYTGLATGYDIESGDNARYDHFMTNAKFDNLINLIQSRQTQEETAIRLMTQHLMLDSPDKRFVSQEVWDAVHEEAPRDVKNLIHHSESSMKDQGYDLPKNNPASDFSKSHSTDTETITDQSLTHAIDSPAPATAFRMETQMVTEKIEKFRTTPKWYTVIAGDYPISIAKKFNISLQELQAMNPTAFPLNGGQRVRVGTAKESYFIDTLIERQVPVAIVPSEGMAKFPQEMNAPVVHPPEERALIDPVDQLDSISEHFDDIYDQALTQVKAFDRSVQNLIRYKEQNETNYIYTTLQSSNPVYGIDKISKIKAFRMQNSDLLRLTYESTDQGVCQQTLYFIYQVFRREYQNIKGSQTSLVSDYFRQQRDSAKIRLDSLEEANKIYRMEHRIINYNEQTKFIAEQSEVLDRDWYDESARLSAAKAALYVLESQMDDHAKNLVQRGEIINLRRELSRITRLITMEEISQNPDIDLLSRYKRDKELTQNQMNEFIQSAFRTARTTEGINMQMVLERWLGKVVEVEESRAKYEVKTRQKREYMAKYDKFAPLGSTLNKIEREIDLAEQEYLNQTHSLDLSLLKQKNNEQSNIKIIDEPYYPIKPNPSRRMITVIAAFLAGLMLTAGALIFLEFMDTSIKLPQRAEELTKSKLLGAYPRISSANENNVDYPLITNRLTDMMTQKIKLEELRMAKGNQALLIMLISTRKMEGKTFIGSQLVEKLRSVGHKVLFIKPLDRKQDEDFEAQFRRHSGEEVCWDFEYEVPDNFLSISNVNELLRNFVFMTQGYQYIFVELPALLSSDFPAKLAAQADLSVLICRATRAWNAADEEVLEIYKQNTRQTVFSMLNGVHVDHLESIIGEIPRKRTWIRKFTKRLINLDFNLGKSY